MKIRNFFIFIFALGASWGAGLSASWAEESSYESRCHAFFVSHLRDDHPPVRNQTTDYTCGPSCLKSAIEHLLKVSPEELHLAELAMTSESDGTAPEDMARAAQHFGLRSRLRENLAISDVKNLMANGSLLILRLQAWGDEHWVLVVATDHDSVYLMDPWVTKTYSRMTFKELAKRWFGRHGTRLYRRTAVELSHFENAP